MLPLVGFVLKTHWSEVTPAVFHTAGVTQTLKPLGTRFSQVTTGLKMSRPRLREQTWDNLMWKFTRARFNIMCVKWVRTKVTVLTVFEGLLTWRTHTASNQREVVTSTGWKYVLYTTSCEFLYQMLHVIPVPFILAAPEAEVHKPVHSSRPLRRNIMQWTIPPIHTKLAAAEERAEALPIHATPLDQRRIHRLCIISWDSVSVTSKWETIEPGRKQNRVLNG